MEGSFLAVERVIIFTRYPEPGKTKTRLIPALGPEGAARIQRRMTERVVQMLRSLVPLRPVGMEIHFEGGGAALMAQWLGRDLLFCEQIPADLGTRLQGAFARGFGQGVRRVVIIGSDCPDLDQNIVNMALDGLKDVDLVLGPAYDGGYYLIGLQKSVPQLFDGIPWGTAMVRKYTLERARAQGLSILLLPTLADVDRPTDLPRAGLVW